AKPQGKRPGWMPDMPPVQGKPARPPRKPARGHQDPHAQREAQRYEHPIPSREAILKFLGDGAQLLTAEALAVELGLTQPRDFEALTKRLAAMLREGQLLQNRRGGYGVAQKLDLIPG